MARRKTSTYRPSSRSQVLDVKVYSPTILWYQVLKFFGRCTKWLLLLGVLTASGYAVWNYYQRSYVQNPDYELRVIKLTPNTALNEGDVVAITEMPLNTSIFGIDIDDAEERLRQRPEVLHASVRRELPSTISIDLKERIPYAWIECPSRDMQARSRDRGFLIDRDAHLYPCPPMQYEAALALPVIVISSDESARLENGKKITAKSLQRALHLLDIAEQTTQSSLPWIDRIQPHQRWAMKVWTRDGIEVTFGLDDHQRQMQDLLVSMEHAAGKGMQIASINLIPQRNIPVVLRNAAATGDPNERLTAPIENPVINPYPAR